MDEAKDERKLTFGEQAVGLSFNPSQHPAVSDIKRKFADVIDTLNNLRSSAQDGDEARMYSVAITEAQTAQMWAVKAATWNLK